MKEFHLITVGKLTESSYQEIELEYQKRLTHFKLSIHELKGRSEDLLLESSDVLKKIGELSAGKPAEIILLREGGKSFDSINFSSFITRLLDSNKPIIFVIGGASGHGKAVLQKESASLSLSPLTFPHKMARLILVEQLYRAQTIIQKHPYHK